MNVLKNLLIYLALISFIAVLITIKDKRKAQLQQWRVPENTLMLIGLLGGSLAMYITMRKIRHKTKHKKFMIGLPIENAIDIVIILFIIIQYIV